MTQKLGWSKSQWSSHRAQQQRTERTEQKIHKFWDHQAKEPIQETQSLCKQRFGFYTDPLYSSRINLDHLRQHIDPDNMPRKPDNLELHNLCEDQSLVTDELLETLRLGLDHNVDLK